MEGFSFAQQGPGTLEDNLSHLPSAISLVSTNGYSPTVLETSTILSDLLENNDLPTHADMNGLLIWLANGKVQLKAQLQTLSSRAQETAKNLQGQYKWKGTKLSRRTEQHHAKLAKDSFAKAQAAGYGDLEKMFLMRKEPVERVDSGENLVLNNDGERVVGVESDQGSMMDPEEWNDLNNWQEEMWMDPDEWDNEMSGNSCGEEAVDR